MAETQRQPVPRNDAGELDTTAAFLTFARDSVLKKAAGLSEEQLRQVLVDTGTTILGLIQHLTDGERYWFGYHLAGQGDPEAFDFSMDVPATRTAAEVVADYRAAISASDAAIAAVSGPDAFGAVPVDGEPRTLRWILAHMTSETARHAGHADILREQIDGTTGR